MNNRRSSTRKKPAGSPEPANARSRAAGPAKDAAVRRNPRAAAAPKKPRAPRRAPKREASRAVLRFRAGWRETREGEIRPGGTLVIDYDPARLPDCHTTWRGADIWNITAHARFHPGGQVERGSVLEELSDAGLVHGHRPKQLEITVPADAARVEVWFHTSYHLTSACEGWDSRFGQNYWFEVARR